MIIKGIGASEGIVIAKAYKLKESELSVQRVENSECDVEIKKLEDAIKKSIEEIEIIREKTRINMDDAHAEIFDAHIQIINDPEIIGGATKKIKEECVNADFAFKETADSFVQIFENMDNEYLRERAADIKDVSKRVLSNILGIDMPNPSLIDEEVIVIAEDLTPSDTAQLDKKYVLGFATDIGGRTSHSAIMARSLEIPAVVGGKNLTHNINHGSLLILDGINGEVIDSPCEETLQEYRKRIDEYKAEKELLKRFKNEKSRSKDGHVVELVGNIGSPEDIEGVIDNGGEGIGLYRTEFLYMNSNSMPSEEEQFEAYKKVIHGMKGKPVVIRTLDIGGDKELPYLSMPEEMNPFLGYRAIRLCLDRKDIFRTQLRALLRASVYGNLKIMFPMIATIDEFREAKKFFIDIKEELIKEHFEVSDNIEVGIMIEIPAAAILADQFAKEVDFFSIGTNDLIQYTFAADRMNERVAYLYQPFNPSLLRLIKMVIDAAKREGKWAGMCGEMAGERLAVPLLLGLGLHEFSMSATSILRTRHLISNLDKQETAELAAKALNMNTSENVVQLVEEFLGRNKDDK